MRVCIKERGLDQLSNCQLCKKMLYDAVYVIFICCYLNLLLRGSERFILVKIWQKIWLLLWKEERPLSHGCE
jgi:hypothetical protein